MKKLDIALLIGLILAIILSSLTSFANSYDEIRGSVVRLHILANSDSDADQALKLKVRDAVLEETKDYFAGELSYYETELVLNDNIGKITEIAEKAIKENGYNYTVSCSLVNMYFDDRKYENFVMPAGYYDALRMQIGEAKGKNWWCVMYPPLCLPAAMKIEDCDEVFTKEEIEILQNPQNYEIRFKCVELYQKLKDYFKNKK